MKKPKIEYIQIKHKNEVEAKEIERKLDRAFNILFEETARKLQVPKLERKG